MYQGSVPVWQGICLLCLLLPRTLRWSGWLKWTHYQIPSVFSSLSCFLSKPLLFLPTSQPNRYLTLVSLPPVQSQTPLFSIPIEEQPKSSWPRLTGFCYTFLTPPPAPRGPDSSLTFSSARPASSFGNTANPATSAEMNYICPTKPPTTSAVTPFPLNTTPPLDL